MKIFFFWVPMGLPCQKQDDILKDVKKDYKDLWIEYISPLTVNGKEAFNDFKIRICPSIILMSDDGDEIYRFPLGRIHSKDFVIEQIKKYF